jgi:hypothetical protein
MRKLLIALALCFYACAAQAQLGWNFGDSPHRSNETFNRLNLGPANANKILATGATGIMQPTLTLPSVVQQNITQTGILTTDILAASGRPWADVRAFGAKGDGVTDDTAAFNAAIAAVTALGSGTIYIPPSTSSYCIKTSGGITLSAFGVRMVGATDGYYSSLDACGTDTTIVTMNNAFISLEHINIAGKGIDDSATFGASQATIKVTNLCISCSIEHVIVTGGAFAIQGLGTPSQHIDDVMLFDVVSYDTYQTLIDIQDGGWWMNRVKLDQSWPYGQPTPGLSSIPNWAASTSHSAGDLVITQGWIIQYMTSGTTGTSAPALKNYGRTITDGTATAEIVSPSSAYYAIHFEGASETQMTQIDMSGSFYAGMYIDKDSSGNPSQYIECSQCVAGQTLSSDIYLNYGQSVYITDSHLGSCTYSGCGMVLVNSTYAGDFNMEGGAFLGTGIGALVGGSGGTTFQGVTFNGQSTGIQVNGVGNLAAIGNRIGVNGTGSIGTITTGINILSGSNHYTLLGNMCINVTTCISDNGGGSDKMVQNSTGIAMSSVGPIVLENSGVTNFSVSSTLITANKSLSLPIENGTTGYPIIHVDEATPIAGVAGGQFGSTPASYIRGISSIYTAIVGNAGLGISSLVVQDGSGGFNYPTGINAFAQLDYAGYWAFPANFICESFTHGGCVSEFDSNNWYANPVPYPAGTFPPDYSTGGLASNNYASGLQIMAGGNYDSMFGLGIGENSGTGSGTQSFIAGIYMWPAGARHYGLLIDATSTTSASYGAYIKSAAANVNLVLQTIGSEVAGNSVFGVIDATNTNHLNIHQDGSIVTSGTLSIGGGSPSFGACGSSPSFPTGSHNNSTGVIAVGTSPSGGTCTLNFSTAYANIESCIASQISGTATPVEIGFNTSSITLSNVVGGYTYSYACFGN